MTVPIEPLLILRTLQSAGYEAYIVGGAVRDILRAELGEDVNPDTDYDFTTNATPEQILELFTDSFCENNYGTVSIAHKHLKEQFTLQENETLIPDQQDSEKLIDVAAATKIHTSLQEAAAAPTPTPEITASAIFEITPFRSGEQYEGTYRRPSSFSWGQTLSEDLTRRDFTINALALKVNQQWLTDHLPAHPAQHQLISIPIDHYTVIDEHAGITDLENHVIRTVGNPDKRFSEDALRMLRAIRFAVQLNCAVTSETLDSIDQHEGLLAHISWERIRDEFLKILASPYPKEGIELLEATGLLHHILPELQQAKGVQQGGHHTTDVWVHSLDALDECPSPDPIVRLATLLHDIGKPETYAEQNGTITFYNHEVVGAHMAKQICRRFNLSKKNIDRVFILVRHHMFYYQPHNTDAAIRRFMRKVGLENIDDILDLREGDRLGSGARRTSWRLEEMKQRMIEQLHQPFSISDLAIDGTDLMQELDLKPGKIIGQLLHHLFEHVSEVPEDNQTEVLIRLAHNIYSNQKE